MKFTLQAVSLVGLLMLVNASSVEAGVVSPDINTTTEVERANPQEKVHTSLRFLHDNRVFIRSELDRLQVLTIFNSQGEAAILDDRLLRLQELADAIAAARDTVDVEASATARRGLLASVTELGDLEKQLGLMEALVVDHRQRLQILEADFLGQQETALVILVRGLPDHNRPAGMTIVEENERHTVPLTSGQQNSLAQGGVAQVFHRYVEPRDHVYTVAFDGEAWRDMAPIEISVSALRDRITFLELDLTNLAPDSPGSGLQAKVWQR